MISINIPQKISFLNFNIIKNNPFNFKKIAVKKGLKSTIELINIPKAIYNKTFNNLLNGNMVTLIFNSKGKNGKCYWTISTFTKDNNNEVTTVYSERLIDCDKLKLIKSLYIKLNKIEKNSSVFIAERYLNGFLEYENITLNQIVSQYALTA